MLGFVTCVWMLAFLMAVPQVAQTYAPWPDEYEDVICPLSAVREQGGRINRSYWFADCCYWKLLLGFLLLARVTRLVLPTGPEEIARKQSPNRYVRLILTQCTGKFVPSKTAFGDLFDCSTV